MVIGIMWDGDDLASIYRNIISFGNDDLITMGIMK